MLTRRNNGNWYIKRYPKGKNIRWIALPVILANMNLNAYRCRILVTEYDVSQMLRARGYKKAHMLFIHRLANNR